MEQIKAILILTLALSVDGAFADCANVQPIKAGEVAACDGFLFSDAAEKKAAEARDDAEYYKKLSTKLEERSVLEEQQSQVLNQRLQLYITEANALGKTLADKNTNESLYRFAYFALGVLVTGTIAANVGK
jgi:hypothetical protein